MKKDSKTPWMDKALAPRDRDGFIQPMIWPGGTDQTGKPLYFPVLPTSKGPMIFEEDFQPGGQYYGQVDYQPGLYAAPLGITANGHEIPLDFSQIRYVPQAYNLQSMADAIHREGIPDVMRNAASQVLAAIAKQGVRFAQVKEDPVQEDMQQDGQDLYLPNSKGKRVRVCNSDLQVQRLLTYINNSEKSFAVEILLTRKGETVTVPMVEVDQLGNFLSEHFPWFYLAESPNAAALLNAYIRDQLETTPKHTVLKGLGWAAPLCPRRASGHR